MSWAGSRTASTGRSTRWSARSHAQRQLVADAGHELRTPIASLRANIQVLDEAQRLPAAEQESLRADIVAELDELTALVADVVELARGTASEGRGADEVRLDAIVRAAIEKAARRGGVQFRQQLEPTVVTGQADRIDRAVGNLLENARAWSPRRRGRGGRAARWAVDGPRPRAGV